MSTSILSNVGTGLFYLGLALIIGGMLALGAFTAPAIFKALPRGEAGTLMAMIFQRYDTVLLIALATCGVGEGLRWLGGNSGLGLREVFLILLTATMLYSTLHLTPQIGKMQKDLQVAHSPQKAEEFDSIHKQAEGLYKLELLLAVGLILITPFVNRSQLP